MFRRFTCPGDKEKCLAVNKNPHDRKCVIHSTCEPDCENKFCGELDGCGGICLDDKSSKKLLYKKKK